MSTKAKYQSVLELGENLGIQDGSVNEENGILKIKGMANTQFEKDCIWDKIKEVGGENASDIVADIDVKQTSFYHKHVVQGGDTLGKISKMYYGKSSSYMKIFEANTDKLKDPNMIYPDQELLIPNP